MRWISAILLMFLATGVQSQEGKLDSVRSEVRAPRSDPSPAKDSSSSSGSSSSSFSSDDGDFNLFLLKLTG
jgi:hypothetical protein